MRVALLLLSILPSVICECYVGAGVVDGGTNVFGKYPCDGTNYCYKLDIWLGSVHTVTKKCGFGCTTTGCRDISTNKRECCCKGKDCNSAAGSTLLVTSLAVAAAVWMRI
ncbi:hypothetical protein PMAYCL1PPCAC_12988 [Pristionchus mayeri]|uniref:Snake toxin/toxin-like domain-containing protein n=1 Tax=Pristionchus mayeri TaxID=1317129 RepID=A0AAN4ZQA0_9BILA|nr:hypothetical protein PMAYCL1PPCAC_12988 [Pristionchus mayeri]